MRTASGTNCSKHLEERRRRVPEVGKEKIDMLKRIVLFGLFFAECVFGAANDWKAHYEPQVFNGMPCRVMKPINFSSSKKYPVIVSLHGGEQTACRRAAAEGFSLLCGGTTGERPLECEAPEKD
jgi:hypothetical protein